MVRLPRKQPWALLSVLLVGYVHDHANEASRLTIIAVQALATRLDPADVSVLLQQPILLRVLFSGGDSVVDCTSDPFGVFGVDARKVLRQRCALIPLGWIDREHFSKASIGIEGVGLHMPVEGAYHTSCA